MADVMREVLVTGGCGFIGTNLVRRIVREQSAVHVTVLDKLTYAANPQGIADLPRDRVKLVVGDVCDAVVVDRLVGRSDAVVHLAAESHNDNSIVDPAPFLRTNAEGTFTLLQAVREHDVRLHHVSTDEVYGDLAPDDPPVTEGCPYRPSSPYAASKAGSDMLVRAWARTYGVRATISNCSNNYGPYQHVEKFVPRQVTNLLDGRRAVLYGDGSDVRDWIHVEDHCAALWEILTRGRIGETYLVGAGGEASVARVLGMVCEELGADPRCAARVPNRPGHDRRFSMDASKLREELGWRPTHTDLREGIARTVAWYRAHEEWWRPAKADTERRYARHGQSPADDEGR